MKLVHAHAVVGLLVAVMLFGPSSNAWAQGPASTRTYGTTSQIIQTVSAFAFTGQTESDQANIGRPGTIQSGRFCKSPVRCEFVAPVSLPAGALVTGIELDACTFANGILQAQLLGFEPNEQPPYTLASLDTTFVDVVGCDRFPSTFTSSTTTIDNERQNYLMRIVITGDNSELTRFHAVRVLYQLQVSPPPASPTFSDVPTNHPFFPFIEALVAAGITGGCSTTPPLFCPDGPVTRKQMAAFLARGLGLHWAP